MTSPSRALAILDLFDEAHPVRHVDDLLVALGYSRATGYRYVKDLVEVGLLQKVAAGRYALGPRIIELDYRLRRSDPVLLAAVPVMDDLVRRVRLDAVLSTRFGTKLVDVHRASAGPALELLYGRGRPRPLFAGAAPKVLLAGLPRPQLARLYAASPAEAAASGLGASWDEVRERLAAIRERGFYVSHGELDTGISGAAVPILRADREVAAALTLVGLSDAMHELGEKRLLALLTRARRSIESSLNRADLVDDADV